MSDNPVTRFDAANDPTGKEAVFMEGRLWMPTGAWRTTARSYQNVLMYEPQTLLERTQNRLTYHKKLVEIAREEFQRLRDRFMHEANHAIAGGYVIYNRTLARSELLQLKGIYDERLAKYREVEAEYEQLPEVIYERQRAVSRAESAQDAEAFKQELRDIRL